MCIFFLFLGIQIYPESLLQPQYLSNVGLHNEDNLEDDENRNSPTQSSTFQNINENELVEELVNDVPDDVCKDLRNISEFGNFGSKLNLKDFSSIDNCLNCISFNDNQKEMEENISQTEFVQVSLNEDSCMTVKKSSLCWLLDNEKKRISNDRLHRFVNNEQSQSKQKSNKRKFQLSNTTQKPKSKAFKKVPKKSQKTEDYATVMETNVESEQESVIDNNICPGCSDPNVVDSWVKCNSCDIWWHEQCTSYLQGAFICDICEDN